MNESEIVEGNKDFAEYNRRGYSIDKSGNCFSKGKKLSIHVGTCGYFQVNTYSHSKQKTFLVHRLVAILYIPNPSNLPEVNHKDGNKLNNNDWNLEWCTRSENIKHGIDTGLIPKSMVGRVGEKHWRSKPVEQIQDGVVIAEYECARDAERQKGYSSKAIFDAVSGKLKTYLTYTWRYKIFVQPTT